MDATAIQILLPLTLFMLMLGLGFSLQPRDFKSLQEHRAAVLVGLLGQLLVLPLITLFMVKIFDLPAALALGLLVVSLAPGGATSNLISHLCRADVALSVSLTGLSSLIVPFSMPLLCAFFIGQWQVSDAGADFPVLATMLKLVVMALLPVCLGMWFRYLFPTVVSRLHTLVKLTSMVFLVAVVVVISIASWEPLSIYVYVIAPVALCIAVSAMLSGYLLGAWVGAGNEQRLSLAVEIGIQNAGTGLLVTSVVLNNIEMSAAVLLYGIWMQLPALLLILWRNRSVGRSLVIAND